MGEGDMALAPWLPQWQEYESLILIKLRVGLYSAQQKILVTFVKGQKVI